MSLTIDHFRADYKRSKRYVQSRRRKPTKTHKMTDRRLLILKFIMDGTGSPIEPWLTLDELLERLADHGYPIDKKAIHFHIRPLVKMGYIEKRELEKKEGKLRRKIAGTASGRLALDAYRESGRLGRVLSSEYEAKRPMRRNEYTS